MMNTQSVPITRTEISSNVLRPFLFFVSFLSSRYKRIEAKDADCIKLCIRVVLQSVNSSGIPFSSFPMTLFVRNIIRTVENLIYFFNLINSRPKSTS